MIVNEYIMKEWMNKKSINKLQNTDKIVMWI